MSGERLVAIDVGTQSVRALAFEPDGSLIARGRIPIQPYVSPEPGWAENDPELYWRAIGEACAALWATGAVRPDEVAAVGLTTQRTTVVVTDADGTPLRPAIVWLDQRRTYGLRPPRGLTGLAFRLVGVSDTVAGFQADAESNWIRVHEPDTWRRIRHYLLLSGFLARRLTGRFVDSIGAQVGYIPFDYRRFRWARPGDWRWDLTGIDPTWLPELVSPASPLGTVSPAAARTTGLPEGLPVIAAAGDKACEVVGSGAVAPRVGALSLGTTATFNTTQRRYVEAIRYVPPYPAAIPGAWNLELMTYRGFWMVDWFKREFGLRETELANAVGVEPEALFEELMASTPPGSMGLMLQPYWTPGVRIPGPEAKGTIIGFGDVRTRAHVYRAILEGLAYALREGADRTERATGTKVTELRVSGGGAQSAAVVGLVADVFGLHVGVPHTHETAGLGAAMAAAVGAGLQPDMERAAGAMSRIVEVRDPDPTVHALYDELYRSVYLRLYRQVRPLYEAIRRITGYPPRA